MIVGGQSPHCTLINVSLFGGMTIARQRYNGKGQVWGGAAIRGGIGYNGKGRGQGSMRVRGGDRGDRLGPLYSRHVV